MGSKTGLPKRPLLESVSAAQDRCDRAVCVDDMHRPDFSSRPAWRSPPSPWVKLGFVVWAHPENCSRPSRETDQVQPLADLNVRPRAD